MNQQEREVIAGIFDRLKQVESAPRDPEAERFIAERVAQQPYAPYAMAQAIHVQEQALTTLHQRVQELEAEVTQAREQAQAQLRAQAQQGGGFLSGLFGGARPAEPPRPPMPSPAMPSPAMPSSAVAPSAMPQPGEAQASGPWAQAAAGRGGGFLAGAMQTAAGVAGGMLLGNALASAFGGGSHGKAEATPQPAADKTPAADTPPAADEARYDTAAYEDDTPDDDDDGDYGDDGGDDWV